jgi:WXG100 family type VII secretion target
MAEVRVSEEALRAAAVVFTSKGSSLSGRVESIKTTQGSLTATWTGESATAYAGYQDRWSTSASDVSASFTSIGVALETMADNFRQVEDAATEVWPV